MTAASYSGIGIAGIDLFGVGRPELPAMLFAFVAGSTAALCAVDAATVISSLGRRRVARLLHLIMALAELVARTGAEGREPGSQERRRLLLAAAVTAFVLVTFVLGPLAGILSAGVVPVMVGRMLRARREGYRQAVAQGAAQIAAGLADALGGGHSVRGAIHQIADGIDGPPGRELRRVAGELAVGDRTEDALEALRERARSHEIDSIVAGILLARRAGGDLVGLLRDAARAFEDQTRLVGEVRAATAQARFTGLVVVLLPLGGAALTELASPGFIAGLTDDFLTAWLVGLALAMQTVAALAIRRLGQVRE